MFAFRKCLTLTTLIVLSVSLLTGCSTVQSTVRRGQRNVTTKNAPRNPVHSDGTIASITPIQVQGAIGVKTYKMMYWSDSVKTEAFLAVPDIPGTYPLHVSCHGGSAIANGLFDYPSPEGQAFLAHAQPGFITLIPEYRGYDGSGGTVQGLYGDTLDTDNAIQAVMSEFSVKSNDINLEGTSMGGGVVLKLASERHDILSVVAVSPFVGMNIVGAWAVENKKKSDMAFSYYGEMLTYGTDNPNSPLLQKESIDYRKITAPVLLLQGTADQHVPWQTVQTFYNDLKPFNKRAKLILYPGGTHGLKDKYSIQAYADIEAWEQSVSIQ